MCLIHSCLSVFSGWLSIELSPAFPPRNFPRIAFYTPAFSVAPVCTDRNENMFTTTQFMPYKFHST